MIAYRKNQAGGGCGGGAAARAAVAARGTFRTKFLLEFQNERHCSSLLPIPLPVFPSNKELAHGALTLAVVVPLVFLITAFFIGMI